jgi:hypothetical protein
MFATTQMGGMDLGLPDVCLTPPDPKPVPYPNNAQGATGTMPVGNVLFAGAPAHNMGTVIPMTNGDNAGVALGVASGTVMGTSRHVTAAFTMLTGGLPQTRMTSVSVQNGTNCPGSRLTPSQTKVLVLAP